jgi:AraC-like DNA-binding protein
MPDSAVRTFTDPEAYHAAMRHAQAEGVVTARGNFRAESTTIQLDRLSLQRSKETLPRTVYSAIDPKVFGIVFATCTDQQAYVNGHEFSRGDVIVFRAGSMGHNRSSTACQWGSIALTHQDAATAGEKIIGRELIAPQFTRRVTPPPLLLSRLLSLHEAAGHLAKTAPDILVQPEVARSLEQGLLHAMVACINGGETAQTSSAHRRHAAVLRRLEEVLEANPDRTLYMAEICAAAGASDRTLRACCQEHLGMSPMRYLWLRRMHLARRGLRIADPAAATVTEVATS